MADERVEQMSDQHLAQELVDAYLLESADGSLDWTDAGELVERMQRYGHTVRIEMNGGIGEGARVSIDSNRESMERTGIDTSVVVYRDHAPRAVAEAALAALQAVQLDHSEVQDGS